ncbi:hypothetical protein A2U01_0049035, partial [Trifolium medium]|nr:hypothetical protein [Trifolium medium]
RKSMLPLAPSSLSLTLILTLIHPQSTKPIHRPLPLCAVGKDTTNPSPFHLSISSLVDTLERFKPHRPSSIVRLLQRCCGETEILLSARCSPTGSNWFQFWD